MRNEDPASQPAVADGQSRFSPKLAIYGIGFCGKILTRLIDEKGWEIVSAYNRAGDKVGQDLGRLAGLGKDLGVIVQDYEKADYSRLNADVALIAGPDSIEKAFPIYERFLKAGVNVLSLGSDAYDPWQFPEVAAKIEALAQANGVTFTGGGLWDMTRIWSGLIAAGPCVRIDSIEYSTTTDPSRQGVHWFPVCGIGVPLEDFHKTVPPISKDLKFSNSGYGKLSIILLQHFGYTVSGIRMSQHEPIVFDEPVYCKELDKELPAGMCVGRRTQVEVDTKEGVTARSTAELRLFKPGEVEHSTWRINGLPSVQITVIREESDIAQASSVLNRVPDVLAAEPGIVPIMKMMPLRPSVLL
jgi:4-hydroxy-tetrahydrodipicolinate reductase